MDTLRFIICDDDGESTPTGRLSEFPQKFDDYRRQRELTPDRKLIVADTPGHEQRLPGMATDASADIAVLLVDARKGLLSETKRCCRIVAMQGARHAVLVTDKMDVISWDEAAFNAIVADFHALAVGLGFASVQAIPVFASSGDNIALRCEKSAWYTGPALLEYMGTIGAREAKESRPFRMPVQHVARSGSGRCGYCGDIVSGNVAVGMTIRIAPGGAEAKVESIMVGQLARDAAQTGDAVTITLDREADISRGQVLSSVDDPIEISDQFQASVLCLSEHRLMPGRPYLIKLHAAQVGVTITDIKYKLDIDRGSHLAANTLELNDLGEVTLYTNQPLAFEPFKQCRALGAFTLIDGQTGETVGAGKIKFALRRASNIHWQAVDVNKAARAALKLQKPACLWFTGLSGSGKSTIANLLEKRLHAEGRHTYLLDGDNVRHGLNRDLGFTEADRVENIRRVAEVAKLMVDAGLIVIASFISPFRAERDFARSLFEPGEFYEVFLDTPLEECEKRDVKGLYKKARRGQLANFTGIDSPYEKPASPEVHLDSLNSSPEECVDQLIESIIASPNISCDAICRSQTCRVIAAQSLSHLSEVSGESYIGCQP